jgi:hypothetical protein
MKDLAAPIVGSSTWQDIWQAGGLSVSVGPPDVLIQSDASPAALPALASLADPTADSFGHFITDSGMPDAAAIDPGFNAPYSLAAPDDGNASNAVAADSDAPAGTQLALASPSDLSAHHSDADPTDAWPDFAEIVTPQTRPSGAAIGGSTPPTPQPVSWLLMGSPAGDLPGGTPPGAAAPLLVSDGNVSGSFAASAAGASAASGASSSQAVTYPGSGFVFNNTFGSGVTATFQAEIVAAENYLQSQFGNAVTVNTTFILAAINPSFSGENSFNPVVVSYSAFVNALQAHAQTPTALAAASALRGLADPSHGAGLEISIGEARILGLAGPAGGTDDTIILNSDYWTASALQNNPGDVEAVLEHELTEGIMGRIGSLGVADAPYWAPMDLFRFTASGQRDFSGGQDGQPTYFSINGSTVYTGLQYHNSINTSGQFDGFDFADWDAVGADANAHDPFGPGGPGAGDPGTLSATDIMIMQALGWAPATIVIEAAGATSLVDVSGNFFFYPVGGSSGPELKYNGAAFVAGQAGTWTPIGAEKTASGYEVAWDIPGSNQFTIWNTDSNGNFVSDTFGVATGNSLALEQIEPSFQQDLNGDGRIGPQIVEAYGSTSLIATGTYYYFFPVGGSSGPELKYNGAAFVTGQASSWTPIAAEQTASGYEVAWTIPGSNQFTAWNTDANGNFVSDTLGVVAGKSLALEQLELSFHQDLNGDGTIGPATTVIEHSGSTSLVEVANDYFFYPVGGSSGPELKYNGAPFVDGQAGTWTPTGAEQTAGGYEVAWTVPGSNAFTVWNTDANGNFVSDTLGVVSGSSLALQQIELTFHQDLNGDGTIGPPIIEAVGATSLAEVGGNFYFFAAGGASGPELKYNGAAFVAGQAGTWTPAGVEQTAGGYLLAWDIPGSNQFTFWNTDSNGNYVSDTSGVVQGTSATLKSAELTLFQDLNGDGYIDTPTTTIGVSGHAALSNLLAQAATIGAGATLELTAGASASGFIAFSGATGSLVLDHSSAFNATITGFTGNGVLASSDVLDLKDIAFASGTTTASYSGTSSGGTLTISDAQHDTAHISLTGNYLGATFTLSSDGNGGTDVIDPPATQTSGGAPSSGANGAAAGGVFADGNIDSFSFNANLASAVPAIDGNTPHDVPAPAPAGLQTPQSHPEAAPQPASQMPDAAHDAAFNFANHDNQGPLVSPIPDVHQNALHPLLIG